MKNFKCEEIVLSITYFISEYFKIISKHRKKLVDVRTRGTNRNPPEKISLNFWQIFLFYMVPNVPVILHEMLLYCFRMFFMM